MNTASKNLYQICFGAHQKQDFATQDALVAWIYDQMCEQVPHKTRPLDRIESIKLGGKVVAARTVLHIWRMVERRRDQEKNKQAPSSC
jgi:hypothetical protein